MQVQALIPEAAVERVNVRIIRRFAGSGKVQRHIVVVGPVVERFTDKLAPVINLNTLRSLPGARTEACNNLPDIVAFDRLISVDGRAAVAKVIDYS